MKNQLMGKRATSLQELYRMKKLITALLIHLMILIAFSMLGFSEDVLNIEAMGSDMWVVTRHLIPG
ncbi:hypothetical protein LguiA_030067 [Lonicera macranthoides]